MAARFHHPPRPTDMGVFEADPKFQALKKIRDTGYTGPINQDGKPVDHWDPRIAREIDPVTGQRV